MSKVVGSEMAEYLIDENIQINGGNGYVRDYPAERYYRDSRVNRIFEGTNEINRLLMPGTLLRRAVKGELPIIQAAKKLQDELLAPALPAGRGAAATAGGFSEDFAAVAGMKKVAIALLGLGMLKYGDRIAEEQEVMLGIADVLIDVYQAESAVLRAAAAEEARLATAPLHADAARVFLSDAAARVEVNARQTLTALAEGDMLRTQLAALRRLLKAAPVNTIALRRRLADATVAKGAYLFRG